MNYVFYAANNNTLKYFWSTATQKYTEALLLFYTLNKYAASLEFQLELPFP